jgi:membrane associated rhomboid family serine protease
MARGFFQNYTGTLVIINVFVFLVLLILRFYDEPSCSFTLCRVLALNPSLVLTYPWTIITSMFVHGGLGHLVANMISLIFIGGFVERLLGKKRFLWLYFLGGLFASVLFVSLAFIGDAGGILERLFGNSQTFAVGASGAIFALGGLLTVLTPRLKVLVFFVIPAPMWMAMLGLVFIFWIISIGVPIGIGNTAHFGGLLAGVLYGLYLRHKYPKKTAMIERYFAQ